MPRVYIHEVVEVDGTRRADYQHHMTANWVPEAAELRRQSCFAVFTLVGSTGPWPRVINIWEYGSWDDLAHNFSVELTGNDHRDPMLQRWWAEAAAFRRGGIDRILVAEGPGLGTQDWESRGGTSATCYSHELISTAPGGAKALADSLGSAGADVLGREGAELVGLWRTAMRADDEVVAIWGHPDWQSWRDTEEAYTSGGGFRSTMIESRQRWLLVDAELSPLRTGRQPAASDRRPLPD